MSAKVRVSISNPSGRAVEKCSVHRLVSHQSNSWLEIWWGKIGEREPSKGDLTRNLWYTRFLQLSSPFSYSFKSCNVLWGLYEVQESWNSPYIKINWEDFTKCSLGFLRNNVVFVMWNIKVDPIYFKSRLLSSIYPTHCVSIFLVMKLTWTLRFLITQTSSCNPVNSQSRVCTILPLFCDIEIHCWPGVTVIIWVTSQYPIQGLTHALTQSSAPWHDITREQKF